MTRRTICAVLMLVLCAMLVLSACGKQENEMIVAAEQEGQKQSSTVLSREEQLSLLEKNRIIWAFEDPYACPWFYTFVDLDHNGMLEVIAASTQGSGIFTYANYYEVLPDGSGLHNCYHANVEIEGPDDWPEIMLDTLDCYYDSTNNRYYYPCEGLTRDGAAHQVFAWYALCLKDGVAEWELLARKDVNWTGEFVSETYCTDSQDNQISEADYDSAVERRFAGMEKSTLRLEWTQVDAPEETPAFAETPAAAETPSLVETPAPTQTPSTAAGAIVITKNPSSEALAIGGKTWFIAHADKADSLTWQVLSPEGKIYSLEEAMSAHPGLKLEVLPEDTIAVSNVPLSMNGWALRARFEGQGSTAVTEPAYLYIGDYLASYDSVIDAYKKLYQGAHTEDLEYIYAKGLSEMAGYAKGVGYALKDLDKDSIPELIIAGINPEEAAEKMVFDLYTLKDGKPVNLATSRPRLRYYVRTDGTILSWGSNGAAYSYTTVYRIKDSALETVELVFTDLDEANSQLVYYRQQGDSESYPSDKSVLISEDEYKNRVNDLESLIYSPLLTQIA